MSIAPGLAALCGLAAFTGATVLTLDRRGSAHPPGPRSGTRRPHLPPPGRRVPPVRSGRWRPTVVAFERRPADGPSAQVRWATARDLRPLLVPGRREGRPTPPNRLPLGLHGRHVLCAEPAQSVIVFGPTQSYKTSGLAVPAILSWEGPVLAASVKTDLVDHTIEHRRRCGSVDVFDPTGSTGLGSVSWSPLPRARTWPGARRAATALCDLARTEVGSMGDADFWYATAARLLAPLLFAAATGRRDLATVVRWVDTQEVPEVLDLLRATGVSEALDAARAAFAKEERQRSSIYTTVETVLEPFTSKAEGTDVPVALLEPATVLAGANTLYLCAPTYEQGRLTPLFASVVRDLLAHVYDRVGRTGRPLDPPLLVVLDEAANLAPLPDLDALASTAAGHGVQLVTVWHDLAQLTARYGTRASTVVNNHRAKVVLSGISDPATLEYASQLIGDQELSLAAVTVGGGGPSTTRQPSFRRLAPPDALRRISPGHGVLVYRDLPPARLRLRCWYDDPWLRARAGPGADRG